MSSSKYLQAVASDISRMTNPVSLKCCARASYRLSFLSLLVDRIEPIPRCCDSYQHVELFFGYKVVDRFYGRPSSGVGSALSTSTLYLHQPISHGTYFRTLTIILLPSAANNDRDLIIALNISESFSPTSSPRARFAFRTQIAGPSFLS